MMQKALTGVVVSSSDIRIHPFKRGISDKVGDELRCEGQDLAP